MKALLSVVIIVFSFSLSAVAQVLQAPLVKPILGNLSQEGSITKFRLSGSTTTIIRSHNKSYRLDSVKVIASIKKEWISDLEIKRDTFYTTGQGYNFHNTNIITLKDDGYPEAFTTLKQSLIAI